MSVKRLFNMREAFFDNSGNPLNGGRLFFYVAGSSTKQTTYNSSLGTVPNSNPMVLDAYGRLQSEAWLTTGVFYKLILTTSTDTDPPVSAIWTEDNIAGINDATLVLDQWISGPAPTYVSATSFTLVGDQTTIFEVGRRVKVTDSGGTKYGTIKTSAFTTLTTITLDSQDSDALATPTSAVSYGIESASNTSHPVFSDAIAIVGGSADRSKRLRFEVDGFTTATTRVLTPPNANLTLPNAATAGTIPIATSVGVLGMAAALNKVIYGFTYANNGTDNLDIAAGGAMDATGAYWMAGAALTKQSNVAWAVGTGAGLLDTGAVGNNDYYLWVIVRSDTGVVDYLSSLSSTAPTMPSNYDFKRLIGWFKRVGGAIVAFHTYEGSGGSLDFAWDAPTLDVNLAATLTTSRRTDAVKVPLNFSVTASLNVELDHSGTFIAWICCPDQTDAAPSQTAAPLGNAGAEVAAVGFVSNLMVRTSATGTIAARANATPISNYRVSTIGFTWARRN